MIIAYVSKVDQDCYSELQNEFTDVKNFSAIEDFIGFYAASRNRDVVLLYRVEDMEEIQKLSTLHFSNNIYIIVIGKEDTQYSLLAGKTGVDVYLSTREAQAETIKKYIIDSQRVIKERRGNSNVAVFTGISGGVGTTTITMNLAKSMADNHPDKNILFLDFAYTKSVSNLFFNILQPEKNIVDIARVQNIEMEEFFDNGLLKYSNNLFMVPGIQKHTDKEEFEKAENIQVYLDFITYMKERFDFILIDIGVFEDINLEIDIQEIADDIYAIAEFNIPSMSILKTYIDIIDRSGWYNKTHVLANRADSYGNITHEEAKKILSKGLKHNFEIDFAIPNDAVHLRECWNEAKLVCDEYPETPFMVKLNEFAEKFFIKSQSKQKAQKQKQKNPFLTKVKQWL